MYNYKDVYEYSKDLDILYVEDDINLQEETSDILEDFFKSVTTTQDGLYGIEEFNSFKQKNNRYYDLIITDLNMPRVDGMKMIKDILAINPEQIIIVVSAYNESNRLIDLIQQGIASFLMKPISSDQLMQILYKTCKGIVNQKQKDEYLFQQSRLASMGQMIDSIAHQWLQPINLIKMQTNLLEVDKEFGKLDDKTIEEYISKQSKQITHLVETLSEFRGFFRPESSLEIISYQEIVDSVLLLLNDTIIKNTIQIEQNIDKNFKVKIVANEFKHLLINIINNAIDAFNEKNIEYDKRKLVFITSNINNEVVLKICDSAGGIPNDIINKIFDVNFTTKDKDKGSGIGLYMSSQIINKIGGKLNCENTHNGVCFKISLASHNHQ